MRRLRKAIIWLLAVQVVLRLAAVAAKRFFPSRGDADSPEFDLVAIADGAELKSRAEGLSRGSAVAVLGGVAIDLRGATLSPDGARLSLLTVMGGVAVRVPDTWHVEMSGLAVAGGHEAKVADPATLPPDAPHLVIDAATYFGGVAVKGG